MDVIKRAEVQNRMLNYYERVQKAVDFIEDHLDSPIDIEAVAQEAFMSLASLYRLFFALTGYPVKEYIRNRRLSLAVQELIDSHSTILDLALKYGFESHEAFTRAFTRIIGVTPSVFKKNPFPYTFERVNVLEKYYELQDADLLRKYPEIKVLKELKPVKVASYCHFGKNPESEAWKIMSRWLKQSGLSIEKDGLRVFGFDNPSPSPERAEYGYEIWVTLPDRVIVDDPNVKTKSFDGGLYAVMNVKGGGEALPPAWQRFMAWLRESKYIYGDHQWLEEHLGFDPEFNHTGSIDIYLPIIRP